MKKFFLKMLPVFLVAAVSISIASCGDPDPIDPVDEKLEVTPTNISLLADKGVGATFVIKSNVAWSIVNSANWLHISSTAGSGETSITVTSLSRNESDVERVADIVVRAGNLSAVVKVTQLSALSSTKVTIDVGSMVKLNYSVAFKQKYTKDVSYYYAGYLEKSQSAGWTDERIVSTLMEMTMRTPSESKEDEVKGISGLSSGTDYYFCTVAFNSKGEQGKLQKYEFRTPNYISNRPSVAYSSIDYDSYYWYWSTAIGPFASKYYMIAISGIDAWIIATIQDNDALVAWTIKDAISSGELSPIVQNGDWSKTRNSSEEDFYSAAWAQGSDGKFSPQLDKNYRDITVNARPVVDREKGSANEVIIPVSTLRAISTVYESK